MRVPSGADWVTDRLTRRVPFFAVRFNDGEMQMMYRAVPEGKVLGTDANPCRTDYGLGKALEGLLTGVSYLPFAERDNVLLGASWDTPRADELSAPWGPFDRGVRTRGIHEDMDWADEHWPLDGVVDGSTVRMIESIRGFNQGAQVPVLVTCKPLTDAGWCLDAISIHTPTENSWEKRDWVYLTCRGLAENGCVFVWAAGCGLKPTAWRLWREFPQSSHVDVGHLFNGAMGLRDYGWLQRQDGPWWEPYFRAGGFADYVRGFVK